MTTSRRRDERGSSAVNAVLGTLLLVGIVLYPAYRLWQHYDLQPPAGTETTPATVIDTQTSSGSDYLDAKVELPDKSTGTIKIEKAPFNVPSEGDIVEVYEEGNRLRSTAERLG